MSLWQYADLLKRINAPRYKGIKDLVVDNGTLICDFSDLSLWEVEDGTKAAATNKRFGAGIKLVNDVGAILTAEFYPPAQIKTAESISFWAYIHDIADVDNIRLYLETTDYKYKSMGVSRYAVSQGWNHLKFVFDDPNWSVSEGFDMANFRRITIAVAGNESAQAEVDIANLRLDVTTRPKIIFHFSDGYKSIHSVALPKLESVGIKGSVGVLSEPILVGNTNYLTIDQLDDLYRAGWCLFNGGHSHEDFATLTDQQRLDEIRLCREFLLANGYTNGLDLFEFPYTPYDITEYRQALLDSGIKAAVTRPANTISAPIADLYQLSVILVYGGNWADEAKIYVDMGINRGDTIIINFHDLVGVDITDFNAVVDYIAGLFDVSDIMTFDEWYHGLAG